MVIRNMDEKYTVLGPHTTLAEMVMMAGKELIQNGLNAFEFDIHGVGPDGPIIIHFEAKLQKTGSA